MTALGGGDKRTIAVILSKYPKERLERLRELSKDTNTALHELSSNVIKRREGFKNKNSETVADPSLSTRPLPKPLIAKERAGGSAAKFITGRDVDSNNVTM